MKEKLINFLQQCQLFLFLMFFVLFAWTQWWSSVAPRLIRGSELRDSIHHAHLSLGATLFFFLVLFFVIWAIKPGTNFFVKIKNAFSDACATAISLFLISSFLLMLYGLSQAWAKDEHALILGFFDIPKFLDISWTTSGYMHAALASISVYLFMGIVFVYLYTRLRDYVKPGVAVALLMILHLLVSLPMPPSLHPIAAFGSYVLTPTIYLIALAIYSFANNRKLVYWPIFGLMILMFLYLPYFAFKVLPPWHQGTSKDVVLVQPQQEFAALRSAQEIFPDQQSLGDAQETTAWCRQCHTVNEGDPHLLGPNLYGIFNQQVASISDYGRYSSALITKGEAGTFWTKENLKEYLTNGQDFAPGNLMNQQTDLSDSVKLNQTIDYLEYLSTK